MSTPNITFGGSIPANYDKFLGPLLFEPYAMDITARIGKDHGAVLELACGTGRVTGHLRQHVRGKLVATDLNPDMIAVARGRVTHPDIEWLTVDMQTLPFEDASFDNVVCQFGIMFVPDKSKAFQEVLRVLRPGGRFIFNTWDRIENNGVPSVANRVVTEFFSGAPPMFYSVPFAMFKPDELRNLPIQNGFSSVDVRLVKKVGRSDTSMDAARGMIEGSPIINEIRSKDAASIDTLLELTSKEIAARFNDKPVISPLQAWVGEATK